MLSSTRYSLETIQEEARQLVAKGSISRQQTIYTLCKYIPPSEWLDFERELENGNFLLRDRIGDLISYEKWQND